MTPAGSLAALALLALFSAPASAADAAAGRSITSLGLGAAYTPSYEGADEHRWRALPLIDIQRGRYFFGTLRGLGMDLSSSPDIAFGPRLGYRFGRDESESSRLRGLGDIDGGLEAGVFFHLRLDSWFIRGDVAQGLGDAADGLTARLGGGRRLTFGADDDVVLEATLNLADRAYNDTFFGVTAAQATASGLRRYQARAGQGSGITVLVPTGPIASAADGSPASVCGPASLAAMPPTARSSIAKRSYRFSPAWAIDFDEARDRSPAGSLPDRRLMPMKTRNAAIALEFASHADARCAIAAMYRTGRGLPEDREKSLAWMRKAAAQA